MQESGVLEALVTESDPETKSIDQTKLFVDERRSLNLGEQFVYNVVSSGLPIRVRFK
jgi:hypothetical protein